MKNPSITINPADNDFQRNLANLFKRVSVLEQSLVKSTWLDINPGEITYISDNVFSIGRSVEGLFQVGDKIKISQSGDKYFYIVNINTTDDYVYLDAGDDYTYTSGTVSSFEYSRQPNPFGFTNEFTSAETLYDSSGSSVTTSTANFTYSMIGGQVVFNIDVVSASLPAGGSSFYLSTPFVLNSVDNSVASSIGVETNNQTPFTVSLVSATIGSISDIFVKMDSLGGNFTTGNFGAKIASRGLLKQNLT